MEVVKMHLE